MRSSEKYLAYMAIPFVLSVHATLLVAVIRMIRDDGKDHSTDDPTRILLDELHERIEALWPSSLPPEDLRLFHFSRYLRNRIIHFGGAAGSNLRTEYAGLGTLLREYWERLADRPLPLVSSKEHLDLESGELIAVLAITKHLADAVNSTVAQQLSRDYWALVVARDYKQIAPTKFGDPTRRVRRLTGHGRQFYGSLALTPEELEAAAQLVK